MHGAHASTERTHPACGPQASCLHRSSFRTIAGRLPAQRTLELKARVRLNLEGEARLKAQREQEESLLDQVIARNPMDLPESMVVEYLDELVQRLRGEGREWTPEDEDRSESDAHDRDDGERDRDVAVIPGEREPDLT